MSIKRFNRLILSLGFYTNLYYTPKQVIAITYDEDSKPISAAALAARYKQYCLNNNIPIEDNFRVCDLPTYKVHK
jgi:hypothetical protein